MPSGYRQPRTLVEEKEAVEKAVVGEAVVETEAEAEEGTT
jgi:hypothetical protein